MPYICSFRQANDWHHQGYDEHALIYVGLLICFECRQFDPSSDVFVWT